MITRRRWIASLAAPLAAAQARIVGSILVHEHVLVDFSGGGRYDAGEVFRLAVPKLEEIRKLGCRRFLDCTPNYLGRDAKLLARWESDPAFAPPGGESIRNIQERMINLAEELARISHQ